MENNVKFFANTDILNSFLKDVRKYKVLTVEEEQKLVNDYKNGDKKAKDLLTCCNLRYIYSEAKKYARNEDEVLDYVDEGVMGLLLSMDTYDINLGFKFMTYARWFIKREMNFYMTDTRDMIVPSNNNKLNKKIDKVKRKFYVENGRDASLEEVKQMLWNEFKLDVKEDCDIYDVSISSIDAEIDDDYTMEDNSEFNNKTCSFNTFETTIDNEHHKKLVELILNNCTKVQADIIKMLYGIGYEREYAIDEVAEKYNLNISDINKIRDNVFISAKRNVLVKYGVI